MENELKSLARARRIGGSLVITIPMEIVKEEQIEEGELLEFAVKKSRRSYFGIAKEIKSFTREDRMKDRF
ncbi:MAG TPA: AbrB/MazE/SpoVT family DNA-binding domain-containing protein [Candidatus Nanoarchaeia archaeon]|nr:AbrB/MazE/SpoVT family DNA-binding domain-containing protein [Candidatus Nanoarchaeia archaeon]